MSHRQKMCKHCAFREGSNETGNQKLKEDLILDCSSKRFYCHETMLQTNPEENKWNGNFDDRYRQDGTKAHNNDHQLCAGFALLFGDELGIDTSQIPTEDHAFLCKESEGE